MIRRLLAGLQRRLHRRIGAAGTRMVAARPFVVHAGVAPIHIDVIEEPGAGLVRVLGWCEAPEFPSIRLVTASGGSTEALVRSRTYRPDIVELKLAEGCFSGFRDDFVVDPHDPPGSLECDGQTIHRFPPPGQQDLSTPDYAHFYSQSRRVGRDAVYGTGPSVDVSTEFKDFAAQAHGRVLDFGCGSGDLVSWLRARGTQAVGLELDREAVRTGLKEAAKPYVTLYAGGLPLPYGDGAFDSIVATEVIEHLQEPERFVPEFHRILAERGSVLVTVPDATSIPASHPTGTVPWHLLESTHVNFFTARAVAETFSPWFEVEAVYGLGGSRVNGWFVPGSIGAVLRRSDRPGVR